jgi:gamma-D-glutamyl-L-lysine dipeptidyl-peptidase
MSYAVCCVPVSPLRKSPAHEAEMVSQLLFGECVFTIEASGSEWLKVRCKYDGYEGWCQHSHVTGIDETDYSGTEHALTIDWVSKIVYNGHHMLVPYGSSLTALQNGKALWQTNTLQFNAPVCNPQEAEIDDKLIKQVAFKFLNTAYLWGGKSVFGTDCSGFTQTVFKFLNIQLPRDAGAQAEKGETVDFIQEVRCGDLAFFDNEEGRIIHVGLLLNVQEIIHAAGKVRIDKIDNAGIINVDTGLRTHQLRIIKRHF